MVKHQHEKHSCECSHQNVKYCSHCKTVYCKDCSFEWTAKPSYTWWYNAHPNQWVGNYQNLDSYFLQASAAGTTNNIPTTLATTSVQCNHAS